MKPCPWCGGTEISVHEGSTSRWLIAECSGCGAMAPEVRVQTIGMDRDQALEEGKARALAEWNNRHGGQA